MTPATPAAASLAGAPGVLLATNDSVFGALCKRALEGDGDPRRLVVVIGPRELLATARHAPHDLLLLDVDGEEPGALKELVTKVMLVSDAPIVLTSGYLAPGASGLTALLQSIPAGFLHKPGGRSGLGLAEPDGPAAFAAALAATRAALGDSGPEGGAR